MSTWSQYPSQSPSQSPSSHDTFLQFTWHLSPVQMTPFSSSHDTFLQYQSGSWIFHDTHCIWMIHIVHGCTSQYIHVWTKFISVYISLSHIYSSSVHAPESKFSFLGHQGTYALILWCQGVGDSKERVIDFLSLCISQYEPMFWCN